MLTQLGPSVIRTLVPILVQILTAQLAKHNMSLGDFNDLADQFIGGAVATGYYFLARVLETKLGPHFGWLLGSNKTPQYTIPAPAPEVPPVTDQAPVPVPAVPEPTDVSALPSTADVTPDPSSDVSANGE